MGGLRKRVWRGVGRAFKVLLMNKRIAEQYQTECLFAYKQLVSFERYRRKWKYQRHNAALPHCAFLHPPNR